MSKEENRIEEATIAPPLVPKKRKKKKWPVIIIILLILGGSIYFFRQPILSGLSKLPVIGNFIPVQENGEENLSMDELKIKVASQEQELEKLNKEIETLKSTNEALNDKNKSLTEYETKYTDFMAQKAAWDESVARTNPDLFIEQFETVYPEVAERIYKTLKGEKVVSDKQKQLATTIGQMDEAQAAGALEVLISTDSELVRSIFEGMATDQRATILSAMSEQSAAQVIKLISPDE